MVNRFIKSGLFRSISYFLVFLLSFNAVFLGFAKKASAELVAGPPVVMAASLLISAGLSFSDTDSLQAAVQTFQDTNSEGWALITAAAGSAYAYNSVYAANVSDSLWQNVCDYVDSVYVAGENAILGPGTPYIVGTMVPAMYLANGAHYYGEWKYYQGDPDPTMALYNGATLIIASQYAEQSDGANTATLRRVDGTHLIYEVWTAALACLYSYTIVINSAIVDAPGVPVGTVTGDAEWLDAIARGLDWGPEGPNQEPPQKKVGFPWPLVGATGVSLTLDQLLDRLLDKHAPDVKNSGPGISEQPYNPPTVDPANPPLDRPSTDAGWLENIWSQMVATKTAVITLSKTVSDFIVPPAPVSVNLEPLKLTGIALTNVFPFSLPWDLARSMNPFYTTSSFVPILSLGPFDMPGVGACTWSINLSNWSAAVTLVRAMELLFFDIGLVLLTRKLMGGAV